MSRYTAADWREDAALGLLAEYLDAEPAAHTLVALDRDERLRAMLPDAEFWHRHAAPGVTASTWPAADHWPRICLRLPKAKAEQDMLIACLAARLAPQGELLLAGSNDEGAKSLPRRMATSWQRVETVRLGKRCRVIRLSAPQKTDFNPNDWAITRHHMDRDWTSWPGLFSAEKLDQGTALLLDHLPETLPDIARVLDYACGTGILAAGMAMRAPEADYHCLDNDLLALDATALNLPQATRIAASQLDPAKLGRFDLLLSNPPFHTGKGEDLSMLAHLASQLPALLTKKGEARLVLQARLAFGKLRPEATIIAEAPGYKIWLYQKG